MLLKKKSFFIFFIFILLVFFSIVVQAQTCEVAKARNTLKIALFDYLSDPTAAQIELPKIKDLLNFYLSIAEGEVIVDCSSKGSESGVVYETIINEIELIPTTLPTCSDGTNYGECSANKPTYCYSGSLINKCGTCGCLDGSICQDNRCVQTSVECNVNADCGGDSFSGNYYCDSGNVVKNYVSYTCVNPGTSNAICGSNSSKTTIDACSGNEFCLAGTSTCQANQTPVNVVPGACVVKSTLLGLAANIPDLGVGYAKLHIDGVDSIDALKNSCTVSIYSSLLDSYCTVNSDQSYYVVMTFDQTNAFSALSCQDINCPIYNCPSNETPTNCGNGICDVDENNITCAADCVRSFCGDGQCETDESNQNCVTDCPSVCGNNVCETGETSTSCAGDCPASGTCTDSDQGNIGKSYFTKSVCNDDGTLWNDFCDGNVIREAYCQQGQNITESFTRCAYWTPTYTCPEGCQNGACLTTLANCGNGACDIDETSTNCPGDCPLPTTGCTDTDGGYDIFVKGSTTGENIGGGQLELMVVEFSRGLMNQPYTHTV